jgi:hypothetical protein
MKYSPRVVGLLVLLSGLLVALPAAAGTAVGIAGFAGVQSILQRSCADCHDWTGSWEQVTGGGRIIGGSLEKSVLYQKISTDEMPASGDKLSADEKALVRDWILAGAPAPGAGSTAAAPSVSSFLLFPDKRTFHEVTGFTSSALLLTAGVLGTIHFLDMMSTAHTYRDAIGFQEGGPEAVRAAEIETAWGADSALRWWHVGFLVAGETLYLGDAVTGISMLTDATPGKLTKQDIHRYAFFTHATLMALQVGLGFAETWALSTGQHDLMVGLGAAHAVIGITIPLVMAGAGLENLLLPE